jgi:hypothetical protein
VIVSIRKVTRRECNWREKRLEVRARQPNTSISTVLQTGPFSLLREQFAFSSLQLPYSPSFAPQAVHFVEKKPLKVTHPSCDPGPSPAYIDVREM